MSCDTETLNSIKNTSNNGEAWACDGSGCKDNAYWLLVYDAV